MNRWFAAPVLVLETVGRVTGDLRATPVIYLRDDAGIVGIPRQRGLTAFPPGGAISRPRGAAA